MIQTINKDQVRSTFILHTCKARNLTRRLIEKAIKLPASRQFILMASNNGKISSHENLKRQKTLRLSLMHRYVIKSHMFWN